MSYIINDNSFTIDEYSFRNTRLNFLSRSIDMYSAELGIETAMYDWAVLADESWGNMLYSHKALLGEKAETYQTSQEADALLFEKYVSLKQLLISRYVEEPEHLRVYGVEGALPTKRSQKVSKAFELIRGHELRTAVGDPKVLPDSMINNLALLADSSVDLYHLARLKLDESKESTENIRDRFISDSYKLKALYNWIVSSWKKDDPRLIALGFAPSKPRGSRKIAAPKNLSYDADTNIFSWEAVQNATSYQLGYASRGKKKYSEAYAGDETIVVFDAGDGRWDFVVRARNKHGYGKWSKVVEI